jgi:hypothetical protein
MTKITPDLPIPIPDITVVETPTTGGRTRMIGIIQPTACPTQIVITNGPGQKILRIKSVLPKMNYKPAPSREQGSLFLEANIRPAKFLYD